MVDVQVFPVIRAVDHRPCIVPLVPSKVFDPTATCQRLAKLPTETCFQVQFPLRIVGIHFAVDLHITNDRHLGGFHNWIGQPWPFWSNSVPVKTQWR